MLYYIIVLCKIAAATYLSPKLGLEATYQPQKCLPNSRFRVSFFVELLVQCAGLHTHPVGFRV